MARQLFIYRACITEDLTCSPGNLYTQVREGTYHQTKAYRPIDLKSFALKTLERPVDSYLKGTIYAIGEESPPNTLTKLAKSVETSFGGKEAGATVGRCCSQRGVLSPLLRIFTVNERLANLNKAGFSVQGFADDVAATVVGDNPEILSLRMQTTRDDIEEWYSSRVPNVNLGKTGLILFTRGKTTKYTPLTIF